LYRKALSIAQEQEAKLWELRAATSLARMWGEPGRSAEARDLLAPVYGWFTEGFDAADLKRRRRCSTNWRESALIIAEVPSERPFSGRPDHPPAWS
jgi:predicted ATPase